MPAMTALPVAPNRNDPNTFADRADALVAALPGFVNEANALAEDVTAKSAVCTSAAQAVAVTGWVSGTTYTQGLNVWDPVTLLTYRRKVTGAGTTRPALDPTNWALLTGFGDVDSVSNQTIGGVKTFSQPVQADITGNAATATAAQVAVSAGSADVAAQCSGNAATVTLVTLAQIANAMAGLSVGQVSSYAFCRIASGTLNAGDLISGASLSYTDGYPESIFSSIGFGTWRCMGRVIATDRGTLFIRVA